MARFWERIRSRLEIENKIFALKTETFRSPRTGLEHDFYILDAGDWVNVIPLTETGEVLLIKQFRHATHEISLEIPGGMIDPGENPERAGARELMEETGYEGSEVIYLGRVRPNPAILTNWCYTYLAKDVVHKGPVKWDGTEEIALTRAKLSEVPGLIARGDIDHALVIAAFYHYFMTFDRRRE